ncbi:MAG: aminopeptidase P family protein [Thaumarchaeota archaeon]|nr:aminopeptidase P family protein [Nitrososphaerota archaeon]
MDIPKSEYFERISKTRAIMATKGIDAMIVYSFRFNAVRYLCGFYPDYSVSNAGLLVLPRDGEPTLFTRVPAHLDTSKKLAVISDVRVCRGSSMGAGELDTLAEDAINVLADHGLRKGTIALAGYVPERGIEWPLRRLLTDAKIVEGNDVLDSLRQIKSENEIALVKKSAEIGNKAYEEALDAVKEGVPEAKIAAVAEHKMLEESAEAAHVHYGMLEGSKRYHVPFDRKIKEGDRYILEVIPRYKGYTTETVGTYAVGESPRDLQELFDEARAAYFRVSEYIRIGETTIGGLVRDVTKSLKKLPAKQSGWFRLGHGMGLDNLEKPDSLSENDETVIKPGMVLAVHPYYQITGLTQMIWGGTFIAEKSGAKPYADAGKGLIV